MDDVIVVVYNLKKKENQKSVLRTANFFGINNIYVLGEKLEHKEKSCMSCHRSMKIQYFSEEWQLINSLKSKGYKIILLEETKNSIPLSTFTFPEKFAILSGHENLGFSDEMLNSADNIVHIENGETFVKCLNTAIAFSIGLYKYKEQKRI